MSSVLKEGKSGEYFQKENVITELMKFEIEATSVNANELYLEGVRAVITRLKDRQPDLVLKEMEETDK